MEPFNTIVDYLERGEYGALATIISQTGATPRDIGAKVFIGSDGRYMGPSEEDAWKRKCGIMHSPL